VIVLKDGRVAQDLRTVDSATLAKV